MSIHSSFRCASSSSSRPPNSSSASNHCVRVPAPILFLRENPVEGETLLACDVKAIVSKRERWTASTTYIRFHKDTFEILALRHNVYADGSIPAEDTLIVYEEQSMAGLKFSMNPFYIDVLTFKKFSIAQLHPNKWYIVLGFKFLYLNHNVESMLPFLRNYISLILGSMKSIGSSMEENAKCFSTNFHPPWKLLESLYGLAKGREEANSRGGGGHDGTPKDCHKKKIDINMTVRNCHFILAKLKSSWKGEEWRKVLCCTHP